MDFVAFTLAVGALALVVAAFVSIFRGRVGLAIVLFVLAVAIGSSAGAVAAYA